LRYPRLAGSANPASADKQSEATKVDYLHHNPLRKGLAVNPEDWEHSSFASLFWTNLKQCLFAMIGEIYLFDY